MILYNPFSFSVLGACEEYEMMLRSSKTNDRKKNRDHQAKDNTKKE